MRIFPQLWNLLSGDEQQHIGSLFEPLLVKYSESNLHSKKNVVKKTNVIKTILETLAGNFVFFYKH